MTTPQFTRSITANLQYWRDQSTVNEDPALGCLLSESENLYRAIEFGLALPSTCILAAELLLDLNYYIEHSGEWRRWQTLMQRALIASQDCDVRLHIRLLDLSGQCFRHDRDWDAAMSAHRRQEKLANDLADIQALAQARLSLASLHWRQRNYDLAERCAQQAIAGLHESGGTDRQLGGAFIAAGLVAYSKGCYDEALQHLEQGVAYFRRTRLIVLLARALVNLALAQEAAGMNDAALGSYQEARALLSNTDYEMDKIRIELSAGTLHFHTGELTLAEEAYKRAYCPFLRQSGLHYFHALAANNLGNVYLEQGRLADAESILRESLKIWKKANARLQLANSLGTLAKVLDAQGQHEESLTYFDQAIAGIEAFPDDAWAGELLAEYGRDRTELQMRMKTKSSVH